MEQRKWEISINNLGIIKQEKLHYLCRYSCTVHLDTPNAIAAVRISAAVASLKTAMATLSASGTGVLTKFLAENKWKNSC